MSEISELEKLYLPSYWTKRYPRDVLIKKYEEITTRLSYEARASTPCDLNVSYGSGDKEQLDIFGTDLPNDAPLFIFVHGGYWQEGGKDFSSFIAPSLHRNGCKSIIVGYTLCPNTTISEIVKEIQLAVRNCLKYALKNKTRSISIGGHSAGAHLVISLFPEFYNNLTEEELGLIKSIFLISGVYNLTPLLKTTINDPLKLTEDAAEALSPMVWNFENVAKKSPKFFVIVSENDSPAFIKQSELFSGILGKQGIPYEFVFLEKLDHFEIVEKMADEDYDIVKFIAKSLS